MIINLVKNQSEESRIERKYFLETHKDWLLTPYIKLAPGGLKEIYFQRKINNIYYDDDSWSFLKDNLIGANTRIKLRLRWYGEGEMKNPNLEIKLKQGNLFYKFVQPYDLKTLPLTVIELIKRTRPTIANSYYRKYYLTKDKKIRLTVDTKIEFEGRKSDKTVVELKYLPDAESAAIRLINNFPLNLQKNSKYVDGMASRIF